jgi:large subunit ribosomal protein L20
MPRSINIVASKYKRKKILNASKGYSGARSTLFSVAKNAVEKSLQYAYIGRKKKKRYFRSLWIQRINAGVRENYLSYSKFIGKLYKNKIYLNRKILADLALHHPEAFKEIIYKIK